MAGFELAFLSLWTLREAFEPEQLGREHSRTIGRSVKNIKCQQKKAKFLKFWQIFSKRNTNCFCFLTVPPFFVSIVCRPKRGLERATSVETTMKDDTSTEVTRRPRFSRRLFVWRSSACLAWRSARPKTFRPSRRFSGPKSWQLRFWTHLDNN